MELEKTDLRHSCREPAVCITRVFLIPERFENPVEWLVLGQATLRNDHNSNDKVNRWELRSYLNGATDFEHDSAYTLVLPLMGVEFKGVEYHTTEVTGIIPVDCLTEFGESFHVPLPGYNPLKHPKTEPCQHCERNHREPHVIVPEDLYTPPVNRELYELVKGREVLIRFSPVRK